MQAPKPLNREELQRLWRWEHQMKRYHSVAIVVLLACAGAAYFWNDITWIRRVLLGIIVVLVAGATILQVRERCPRCRSRLRTKTMLRLPPRCQMCGVAFERPPEANA